jgi:hypothetical protein
MRGNRLRDIGGARVKIVDHQGLHWDRLVRAREGVHIEPGLFSVLLNAELAHFLAPSTINFVKSGL